MIQRKEKPVLTDLAYRDESVLEVLSHAKRMIYNYAVAYRLDIEDITQDLACKLLELWDRASLKDSPKGYLYGVARKHLIRITSPYEKPSNDERSLSERPLSLDIPVHEDDMLGDMLPAIEHGLSREEEIRMDTVILIVHGILRKCSQDVQIYAIRVFELTSYEPAFQMPEYKPDRMTGNKNLSMKRAFMCAFREDSRLSSSVGLDENRSTTKLASDKPRPFEECRKLLRENPTLGPRDLVRLTGCGESTARKMKTEFRRKERSGS
jgi:Sigma-70 region 2